MTIRAVPSILKEAVSDFFDDQGPRMAAALSFYGILSLAPLLLVLLALTGHLLGQETVGAKLVAHMRELAGEEGAQVARTVVEYAGQPTKSALATGIGLVLLTFGASSVFLELQEGMNVIWKVKALPWWNVWGFIRARLVSFGMLAGLSLLLLISLAVSAALAVFNSHFPELLTGAGVLWHSLAFVVSVALSTALFAFIFKYLPDVIIAWRDAWIGASVTAILFALGKLLVGLYLGWNSVGSAYGAAGAIIVLLVWTYYSSIVVLLGAEFTKVCAYRFGSQIRPAQHAVPAHSSKR